MLVWKKSILQKRIFLALLITSISGTAFALPQNGSVTTGSGNISQNGNTMNVTQNTAKMGVNWQSFNIAKNETVNFHQPNASSVALNRVVGNDASAIYGALNANGQVFLINPNGVTFAPGASINVGGIAASTKDITDANFLAGKYNFAGASTAGVTNQGNIAAAEGGYVALMANNITNEGNITAPKGSVALGAGNAFTLTADIAGKVNLAVDEAAVNAAAVNKGNIKADGGYVVMKANDAANVINSVVTNTGIIEAKSLKNQNGEIVLDGGNQGIVNVGGTLNTSAAEANTAGGNITVKGLYTNVNSDANLMAKATGTQAGGTIETSGDYLYVAPEAIINASSENGKGGTWLLDPEYVEIVDALPSGKSAAAYTSDSINTYDESTTGSAHSYILTSTIENDLNHGTSVNIVATDKNDVADILVEGKIEKTAGGDAALNLKAERAVTIDADITSTSNKLSMNFWSDSVGDGIGAVVLNANLKSNGGDVTTGSGHTESDGSVGTYIGLTTNEFDQLITAVGSGNINDSNKPERSITTNGGKITMYGDLLLGTGGPVTFDTTNGSSGGDVTVTGKIDSGNFYRCVVWDTNLNSTAGHTWEDARTQAYKNVFGTTTEGKSALWDSYLTNITSALENSIVLSTFTKSSQLDAYYIGAHAESGTGTGTQTDASRLNVHMNNPRTFYWTDGPEAGQSFYYATGSGSGNSDSTTWKYTGWHGGEPNNDASFKTGQNAVTVGYDWPSKWDDNTAANDIKGSSIEIKGYIQETNNFRSALTVKAGSGSVDFKGDIGSQKELYALNVNNTGNVTTEGTVKLQGDLFNNVQYGGDMDIESTGTVTMQKSVDATGHIYIGQTVAPAAVIAKDTITAGGDTTVRDDTDQNIKIGTTTNRVGSVELDKLATADDGIAIYTTGNITTGDGLTANGLLKAGDIILNASGAESMITLAGTTKVTSTADAKDDIYLTADKMALNGPVTTNGSTGVVAVSNYTAGNTIDLGSTADTTAMTLELSSDEINKITTSKLLVGTNDTSAGDSAITQGNNTKNINITAAIAPAGTSVVHMYTGVAGGQIKETTSGGVLSPGLNGTLNLAITADNMVYLDNANNITTFAATSTGGNNDSIRLNTGDNNLTIGTVDGVTGVTSDKAGDYSAIVLATNNNFINDAGATGVSTTGSGSYWRIFSNDPSTDQFGPGAMSTYLPSGSYADWTTPYAQADTVGTQTIGASNVNDAANHYIFKAPKSLVFVPVDTSKTYGTDLTSYATAVKGTNYNMIGSIYDAYTATDLDIINSETGKAALSSTGLPATADVGTYKDLTVTIYAADGVTPLTATTNGYLIKDTKGKVIVTPVPLNVIVEGTKVYGDASSTNTADYTVSSLMAGQLKNGNTIDVSGLTLTNNVGIGANVGSYYNNYTGQTDTAEHATASGTLTGSNGFKASNYIITFGTKYTVTPAPLTITLDDKKMTAGDAVPALTKQPYVGLKNGDPESIILDTGIYTTGTSSSGVGRYPINFSGTPYEVHGNYTITLVPGTLTIIATTPTPVTPTPVKPNPVNPTPDTPAPVIPDNPEINTPNVVTTVVGNHNGEDENGGLDRNVVREAMPTYVDVNNQLTRVGAYDVADAKDGVKMHPTMNTVPDPKDDQTQLRETTVAYTQNNITGTFKVVFDGSIVKVAPQDAAAKQLVAAEKEARYVELFKGALNTALNDMGVILEDVRALYLLM